MMNRRWSSPRLGSVISAALVAALAAAPAEAQVAADSCDNAPLIGEGTYGGTTVGATVDGSTDCDFSSNAPDVWYRVTPTTNALVLDLCASSYDTVVSVHTGCPGNDANTVACNDQSCGNQSRLTALVTPGTTYLIRISGWMQEVGAWSMTVSFLEIDPPTQGPDVVYQNITDYTNDGEVGGIRAYCFGTATCNNGDQNLLWTNGGTPGVGFNLYRLYDGRLEQIGMSWVKIACCAAAGAGCNFPCNGQGGSVLGMGCMDIYGAGINSSQPRLKPRSEINPWTGQFGGTLGTVENTISRRLQVARSDLTAANFPGALYFAEGVYVADDELPGDAKHNNASHRMVTVSQSTWALSHAPGTTMQTGVPAIQAWHDHGLGANTPDPNVVIQQVDVPDEGRFWTAYKVVDNGNGTWRYEYAVFNLNSHVSGGSLSIPVPAGVTVSNIGFHDVDYHSGEVYDNTDWVAQVGSGSVTWHSPQTFAQNPNSNALRWGTMYNFWFDADAAPAQGQATLGLFRPHTPNSVQFAAAVPGGVGSGCATDWNGDNEVNSSDISAFLSAWLLSLNEGTMAADFNGDLTVNSTDISAFLSAWLDEVTEGC